MESTSTPFVESMLKTLIAKVDDLAKNERFNKEYLTAEDAADYLCVNHSTLLRWANLGMIPTSKPFLEMAKNKSKSNSRVYFKKSDLIDLLERNRGRSSIADEVEVENMIIDRMFGK